MRVNLRVTFLRGVKMEDCWMAGSAILPTQSQQHDAKSGPAAIAGADRLRPCGFSLAGMCGTREGTGPNLTS